MAGLMKIGLIPSLCISIQTTHPYKKANLSHFFLRNYYLKIDGPCLLFQDKQNVFTSMDCSRLHESLALWKLFNNKAAWKAATATRSRAFLIFPFNKNLMIVYKRLY